MSTLSIEAILTIVTSILTVLGAIYGCIKAVRKWKLTREQEIDLSLFFGEQKNILEYRKNFVRTKAVDRPPDDEDDYKKTQFYANKIDLIDFFIKNIFKSNTKLSFLILADAGMGKTTFLVNLFLEYSSKIIGKKFAIRYVALGDPSADQYIAQYKRDGSFHNNGSNTILLLDAFDEDPKALDNYSKRFNEIILNCRTFSKVIITSRTQFFPEEEKEKFSEFVPLNDKKNSYLTTGKKYIAPFSDKEVTTFLKRKYSRKFKIIGQPVYLDSKRKIAEDICEKATNLVARPMLLENIDLIISENKKFNYESEIYETLIQSWILRESKKQKYKQADGTIFQKEMNEFIQQAAILCYQNFLNGYGLFIEGDSLKNIANNNAVDLDKIDLSTRSLLNRNSKGRFKFSHKTILEFLLAKYDLNQVQKEKYINFASFDFGLYIRNQMAFLKSIKTFQPLYFYINHKRSYQILNEEFAFSLSQINKIIAVNYDTFVVRKIHFLENLETIYLLDINPSSKGNGNLELSSIIDGKVAFIELTENGSMNIFDKDGESKSFPIYTEPVLNDEYFKTMNLKVYKIKERHFQI